MATDSQLQTLETWLEWAGAKLVALPAPRIKPANYRTYWPDFSQDLFQIIQFRKVLTVRALAPSAEEITLMDEILYLPSVISDPLRRRVIQKRTLIHPITQRHLVTWTALAKAESTSPYKIQTVHQRGLREVWGRVPDSKLNALSAWFDRVA